MKARKTNRIFRFIILFLSLGFVTAMIIAMISHSHAITIGVATSTTGPYADEHDQLINGAELMVKSLNHNDSCSIFLPWNPQCGINGHLVKIQPIQSENDAQHIVAAIGDFRGDKPWNKSSFYSDRKIPAILISPTDEVVSDDTPYLFRMVPDNKKIGTLLANYARKDIGAQTASIIYDSQEPNSAQLHDGFRNPYISLAIADSKGVENRGRIAYDWDMSTVAVKDIINKILSPGPGNPAPGLIFMAVDAEHAKDIVKEMRRKGIRNIIVGNTDLAGDSFSEQFSAYGEERTQPGYFTDGMYAISPIIFDGASESAQTFRAAYLNKSNGAEPSWAAALAYDAIHVISTATHGTISNNLEDNRQALQTGLKALDGLKGSDYNITGKTYFQLQDSGKSLAVGVFKQGKFISAPIQYDPVDDIRYVPDFKAKLADGRIITEAGSYYYKTDIIYSGVNFNEISNINENEPSYFADFYLWFRYRNDNPSHDRITPETLHFINALNQLEVEEVESHKQALVDNESRTLSNDLWYKLFRVKGEFTSAFDFKNYPFDQQSIEIRLRHNKLLHENLIFVVDQTTSGSLSDAKAAFNSGGDWRVGNSRFYQDSIVVHSSLGNPEMAQIQNPNIEYSTFNARIPISRNLLSFMLRNLLPVLFSIALAYLSFFLPRTEFGTREGILSGTILSIAFFHLSVSSFLGSIGYTTTLDNIFYMFYAIILMGLYTTLIEWIKHLEAEDLEKKKTEIENLKSSADAQHIQALLARIEMIQADGRKYFRFGQIAYPTILAFIAIGYGFYYRDTIFPKTQSVMKINTGAEVATNNENVLRLGSWRPDDRDAIEKILAEFEKESHIKIAFEPTVNNDYERLLRLQLEKGNAPDLIYLSPNGGRVLNPESLYPRYIENLNGVVPSMKTAFDPADLKTWQTANGDIYGIPIYAVSHGIYYNKQIFAKLGIETPKTWDELIEASKKIKAAGITPIANGTYQGTDAQRSGDYLFLAIAPTYLGGSEGRANYADGKSCYNDSKVVNIFKAIQELAPYMADDANSVSYNQSLDHFYRGEAAMYFSGSFDMAKFKDNLGDTLGVFPIPAPSGYKPYATFHIDTAIGLNANSKHKKDALVFLKWLTGQRFGELVGQYLPGFYPLEIGNKGKVDLIQYDDPIIRNVSKDFLEFNSMPNMGLDVRWDLPIAKAPDGRTLMQEGIFHVVTFKDDPNAPQWAADHLQNGLAQWNEAAQMCNWIPTSTPLPTAPPTVEAINTPELQIPETPTPIP